MENPASVKHIPIQARGMCNPGDIETSVGFETCEINWNHQGISRGYKHHPRFESVCRITGRFSFWFRVRSLGSPWADWEA